MVKGPSLLSRMLFPQLTKDPLFLEFLRTRGLSDTPSQRLIEIGGSVIGFALVVTGAQIKEEHLSLAVSLAVVGAFAGFLSIRHGALMKYKDWLTTRQP